MNDKELRQAVIDELEFEQSIDAADIGVAAENSVVTLSGHVPTYAQKMAAERAAWRVKGVKAIAEEIQVRLPGDKKQNDDEIAQRALSVLAWGTSVPRDAIRVTVQHGIVTLTGEVHWNYQRAAAEANIRRLSGVTAVINSVTLASVTLAPAAQPSDIKQHIQDALKRHAAIEAARIEISVRDGGNVSLNGVVDNWDERQAVERAVWSTPGVRAVEDHLRIR
jgi:osmotically-inducible protein OsmY